MIKITNESHLVGLEKLNIPDVFRKYIVNYYNEMLSRFECVNLDNLGSIFVLESKKDVEDSMHCPKLCGQYKKGSYGSEY